MNAGDLTPCDRAQANGAGSLTGRRILIVDDDENASAAVADLVRNLGYEALTCGHAPAALELLRTQHVDVILADYRMPEMTGLDLVCMLRQDGCNIPVVMMTGYAGTADRISSERGDHVTVLRKPIDHAELRKALQEHLPSPPAAANAA